MIIHGTKIELYIFSKKHFFRKKTIPETEQALGSYTSDERLITTGRDKVHIKSVSIHGNLANETRQTLLCISCTGNTSDHQMNKKPRSTLYNEKSESL